jgi:mRNA-degrading endonuclease RelE of RelBE toxin-antitoxin system
VAWNLRVAASAERSLGRLPEGVAAAVVEFMVGLLGNEPERVGKPLQRELAGYHSARRGAYRVVYRLDPAAHTVRVIRIEHRSDVYRNRQGTRSPPMPGTASPFGIVGAELVVPTSSHQGHRWRRAGRELLLLQQRVHHG